MSGVSWYHGRLVVFGYRQHLLYSLSRLVAVVIRTQAVPFIVTLTFSVVDVCMNLLPWHTGAWLYAGIDSTFFRHLVVSFSFVLSFLIYGVFVHPCNARNDVLHSPLCVVYSERWGLLLPLFVFNLQVYKNARERLRNVLGSLVLPKGKTIEQLAIKYAGGSVERSKILLQQYQASPHARMVRLKTFLCQPH